tara:strand:+ start:1168 stop:1995 length:828 start_codon:yes stop_codon:yes gene_type:complete
MSKIMQKNWMELIIESKKNELDILSALFQNQSIGSVNNRNSISIFFPLNIKDEIEKKIINYNKKFKFNWSWNLVKDEDWHLTWKERFVPIMIGDRITIVPSWDRTHYSEINVRIEPGRAFGTGHHQTTNLAIELIENLVSNTSSVLDLGTGSGILSIVASFLGAKKIDSVEIDTDCIENFKTNLILNKKENKINFYNSDVLEWKNFNYDIIVANINKHIILKLIPNLKGIKSKIIFTGLLKEDELSISDECIKNNMKINLIKTKDEWIAMEIESV